MKTKVRILFLCRLIFVFSVLMCFTFFLQAKEKPLLLLSDDGPPHMIQSSKSGIDIDITLGVFNLMKKKVNIKFAALNRSRQQVIDKRADVVVPTFYQADSDNFYLSDPIIQYKPTVFSLKNNKYMFKNLLAVKGLKVVSFQGALGYFGDDFKKMSTLNDYKEMHDMSKLPEMLISGRVDIVILDYYIFYYYLKMLDNSSLLFNDIASINAHQLMPKVNAHVGFNDKLLRDRFNFYLALFIKSKSDVKVIHKYIGNNYTL